MATSTETVMIEVPHEGSVPPILPEDPMFKLEATTIYISREQGFAVGIELLKFLAMQTTSLLRKVRWAKYAVTADVFDESGIHARIKFRIYDVSEKTFAIEMQRRSGCAVVFGDTFRRAVAFGRASGV